ncbi:MAG: response regulator [Phycisphaerales bacterium]|nr:response regulator [Phycisphaerales bacterium]
MSIRFGHTQHDAAAGRYADAISARSGNLRSRLGRERTTAWLVLSFAVGATAARADTDLSFQWDEPWRWARFTTDDGLPSPEVTAVAETSSDTVWIGTRRGLAWFDAYQWHVVDPMQVPDELVSSVAVARDGRVAAVVDRRLYLRSDELFRVVPVPDAAHSMDVVGLVAAGDGFLLLTTHDGGRDCLIWSMNAAEDIAAVVEPAPVLGVHPWNSDPRIFRTAAGSILLNTWDGVYRHAGRGWELLLSTHGGPGLDVSGVVEDADGFGLIAVNAPIERLGLYEFKQGAAATRCAQDHAEPVGSMAVGPNGLVVVAFESGAIAVRRHPGEWSHHKTLIPALETISLVSFREDGDLWVGVSGGLYLARGGPQRWNDRWVGFLEPRNRVHEIIQGADGAIWIATSDGVEQVTPDGAKAHYDQVGGRRIGAVTGLAEDENGHIWITSGSGFQGAYRWDGREWAAVGEAAGLPDVYYHRIEKDLDGRLWFLGLSSMSNFDAIEMKSAAPGAYVRTADGFAHWGVPEGLINGRVYAFAEGPRGTYWFGTAAGLSRRRDGVWTHWTRSNGLFVERVFTVAVDHTGRLWFGDQVNGLWWIDENDRPRSFRSTDGLVNDAVWDLAVGPDGVLWIGTEGGLGRYEAGVWSQFAARTGLRHTTVWPVLPLADRVYVGTRGGGMYALRLREAADPVPIVETFEPWVTRNTALVRWRPHSYWARVASGDIETQWRVDGGPWSPWSTGREARLEHMPAGEHRFEVRAKSLFGKPAEQGRLAVIAVPLPAILRWQYWIIPTLLLVASVTLAMLYTTRRRRFHRSIRRSEGRLQSILDNSPAVIYVKDTDGKYLLINRRFEGIFHVRREDLVGRDDSFLFSSPTLEALQANDQTVLAGDRPVEFEEIVPDDEGVHTYISLKFPLRDETGAPYAVCGISTDITERQRIADDLARAKHDAEAANRAKSIFLANISHEIRTPMMATLAAAELLAQHDRPGSSDAQQRDVILRNGRYLSALISDLLDLSQAESGAVETHISTCSLIDLLVDVRAALPDRLIRPGVSLRLIFETPVPETIETDPTRLRQAVINLVHNALKFTSGGHVHVRVRAERHAAEPRLAVVVEDTGAGIPADQMNNIFESFTKLDRGAASELAGVGLGLTLARRIAERLNGSISVESAPGRGSTFTLRVPVGAAADRSEWSQPDGWTDWIIESTGGALPGPVPPTPTLHGDILLAEDFDDTRRLVEMALLRSGARVVTVRDGAEAVRVAAEGSFDLILMDVRMPVMDGIAATRELRRRGILTPIIALTASISDQKSQRLLDAGFDDFWHKPLTLVELVERTASYLACDHRDAAPSDAAPSDAPAGADLPRVAAADVAAPTSASSRSSAMQAVCDEFAASLPDRIESIRSALASGSRTLAHEHLHQLVGSAGIHGFMEVSADAARILAALADGPLPHPSETDQLARLARPVPSDALAS